MQRFIVKGIHSSIHIHLNSPFADTTGEGPREMTTLN